MHTHWLRRDGSDTVILFFSGWGTDYRPFADIPGGGADVLCLYAYHTGSVPDWSAITAPYRECRVVAWSMGVLQAELALLGSGIRWASALAVGGSLRPVDDCWGIPRAGYQLTIDSFSDAAWRKFIQRMCRERAIISRYSLQLPDRQAGELQAELIFHQMQSGSGGLEHTSLFTKALIGTADMIFPPDHLRRFWQGKVSIVEYDMPHFVFYCFASWAELAAV